MTRSNDSLEDLVSDAFAELLEPAPGDAARLEAMVDRVAGAPTPAPAPAVASPSIGPWLVVLGAVVLVVAAVWSPRPAEPDTAPPSSAVAQLDPPRGNPPPPPNDLRPPEPAPAGSVGAPPPPRPDSSVADPPSPTPRPLADASTTREPSTVPRPARRSTPSTAPADPRRPPTKASTSAPADAQSLLREANQARRDREYDRADALYTRLHLEHPDSRASTLALVTQARMRLDHLSRYREALEGFDAYLERQPDGTLAQEAMVGRARALERLGRDADATRAWEAVAERFPASIHADRASR